MQQTWMCLDTYTIEYQGGFIKPEPELVYDQTVYVNLEQIACVTRLKDYPGFCVFHLTNGENYTAKVEDWDWFNQEYVDLIA